MNQIKSVAFSGSQSIFAAFVAVVVVTAMLAIPQARVSAMDDEYSPDFGSAEYGGFDTYSYDVYEPYENDTYDTYSYDTYEPYEYDTYSYDTYEPYNDNSYDSCDETCDNYYNDDDHGFNYNDSGYGGSSIGHSTGGGYPMNPPTYYPPSYPKNPPTYNPPPVYHAPQTPVYNPPVTNNTCVNNSCNDNSVTNINNSVNNSGNTSIATVVPIAAAPIQYQVQYVQPTYIAQTYCSISITNYGGNTYGAYGNNQLATLSWNSNGSTGYISPTVGTVSGNGSMQVYPVNGQSYTMTVYGQGGSATCRTQPYYVAVAPIISNPTPYVSLSQIPYTGFDFGALGNSIYWLSLVAFAGAAAYLVLYFQGGALAVIGANRSKRSTEVLMPRITVSRAPAPVVAKEASVAIVSPIQISSTATNTIDNMQVIHSKDGSAPRLVISRS